jgi:hypothetical protein
VHTLSENMKAMPERMNNALGMQIFSEHMTAMPERLNIVPGNLRTGIAK